MALPTRADRDAKSILPKTYDPTDKMIRWQSGRIEGTDYALRKDGSAVSVQPRIPTAKERRREVKDRAKHPGGIRFICECRAFTYHFPSHDRKKPKGYEKTIRVETYQCSACGKHSEKELVDEAIREARSKAKEAIASPPLATSTHGAREPAGTREWTPPPPAPQPGAIKRVLNWLRES